MVLLMMLATVLSGCVHQINHGTVEPAPETLIVTQVIDGDTIEVVTGSGINRVRIIGIDTPEMDWEHGRHECYAREASNRLRELIGDDTVTLHFDSSQGNSDRFDRLLRHVYIDEKSVALTLIEEGYGVEYTYASPYRGQPEYRAAQREAKRAGRGLWDACRTQASR